MIDLRSSPNGISVCLSLLDADRNATDRHAPESSLDENQEHECTDDDDSGCVRDCET